ncbi:acetyl-CoA hydrolase/transferase family protein [Robbsia sp. KACC 23696]|uniref:acetyl-CoA hydrolase/transferase family protein n=1 Tax=Robbsia sp. KACC 23696 TaxID=3149231 RepID=UPI00325B7708
MERIQRADLLRRICSAEQAAQFVSHGKTVGMSGFTKAGDVKALPKTLAERAAKATRDEAFSITVITGASLGHNSDGVMAGAGLLARRLPFQVDTLLRRKINEGEVMYLDQHLSETAEQLRSGHLPPIDVAIIEAVAILDDGSIVPTMSVGNSASFVSQAKRVIVELNTSVPLALVGMHDIYLPEPVGQRQPIPLTHAAQRIGQTSIKVDPAKIVGIVITDQADSPSSVQAPDLETSAIAHHIVGFLSSEVEKGRMSDSLLPLQVGIGSIANAVMHGLIDSPFNELTMYSEVLQDSAIALLDSGTVSFASTSSVTLSEAVYQRFVSGIEQYRDKIVLRPQEISNHPEIIRRLGIICLNTALEFDIYGNVNSTHVCGTHMMNGIGGSGDFARNGQLSIFVTKSIAKGGQISSVVPMVSHVDHSEHDVDVVVTECGLADLRGLAPRERAALIIEKCAHPDYRDALRDYVSRAQKQRGGQTPHLLEEAFSWHTRFHTTGNML